MKLTDKFPRWVVFFWRNKIGRMAMSFEDGHLKMVVNSHTYVWSLVGEKFWAGVPTKGAVLDL